MGNGIAGRMAGYVGRTWDYLKRNGWKTASAAVYERLAGTDQDKTYVYTPPTQRELARQREQAAAFVTEPGDPPFFSVVVPVFNPRIPYFKKLLRSMQEQTWTDWELILADAGTDRAVRAAVEDCADARIRLIKLTENNGISENTNAGLEQARGRYVGLLDHDDWLSPDALYRMAAAIRSCGTAPVLLYSDEDKYTDPDEAGSGGQAFAEGLVSLSHALSPLAGLKRLTGQKEEELDPQSAGFHDPNRKPDFNLDLFLTNNYICHFLVMRADVIRQLKLRGEYDGAQDYDLVLRALSLCRAEQPEKEILHVPYVLYHWRCHRGSTAMNPSSKDYAYEAGRRALEDFCRSRGWQAQVSHGKHRGFYEIRYREDILQARPDVAAVAGPIPASGSFFYSGIYDLMEETGEGKRYQMRYHGLHKGLDGYLHRAGLAQDVEAADVRSMRVRPEAQEELEACLQRIRRGEKPYRVSVEFSEKIRESGQRILWLPDGGSLENNGGHSEL